MLFAYFCLVSCQYSLKVKIIGPTTVSFTYIKPNNEEVLVEPLPSATSQNSISYSSNKPFTYTFKFDGCEFSQSGEETTNKIVPEVDDDYLKNICAKRSFPQMLEATYIKVKNNIELNDVQLFCLLNNKYEEIKKGETSKLINEGSYFTINYYIKSSKCTNYVSIGAIKSYIDSEYVFTATDKDVPAKCVNSGDGDPGDGDDGDGDDGDGDDGDGDDGDGSDGDGSGTETSGPIKYMLSAKRYGKLWPLDIYIVNKEGNPSIASKHLLEALPIKIHDKVERASIGSCSSDGNTYTIEGETFVTVQSSFQNICPNAENLIISGANSITFQGGNAFKNSKLKTIKMSASSFISLQSDCFEGISSLETLSLSSRSVTIQGDAFKGTGLSTVSISGSGSVSIQGTCFRSCISLTSVELSGLTVSIQGLTFSHCPELSSFTIRASSTATIQSNAFCGCNSLTRENIDITASTISINDDAFNCDEDDNGDDGSGDDGNGDDGNGDDGSDTEISGLIKYTLPARRNGKLRQLDITIVEDEGIPIKVSSKHLLETLPVKMHIDLPDSELANFKDFKVYVNCDPEKFSVDKSSLPSSLSDCVEARDLNGNPITNEKEPDKKDGPNVGLIVGIVVAVVVVIAVVVVVVIIVIKKKNKNNNNDNSTDQVA